MEKFEFLFGSRMLKLDNPRDYDRFVFVNKRGRDIMNKEERSVSMYTAMIRDFREGKNIKTDPFKATILYQTSNGFVNAEDYPFADFNIFDCVENWKKWLKVYVNDEQVAAKMITLEVLPKICYHLVYQYYMITENTHWISDEGKAIVQKIHDLEMPGSYFETIREMINSL